jgi:hypothetical protein
MLFLYIIGILGVLYILIGYITYKLLLEDLTGPNNGNWTRARFAYDIKKPNKDIAKWCAITWPITLFEVLMVIIKRK